MLKLTQELAYELVQQGKTYNQVAVEYGTTYESVRSKARRWKRQLATPRIPQSTVLSKEELITKLLDLENDLPQWNKFVDSFKGVMTIAFLTDIHFPEHDPRAVELALKITEDINPDVVNTGSDELDFETVSTHFKASGPNKHEDVLIDIIDPHLLPFRRSLRDAAPRALRPFMVGNHDWRLYDWLMNESPQVRKTVDRDFVGRMRSNGSLWLGWDALELSIGEDFLLHHGTIAGQNPAQAYFNRYPDLSSVSGHVHRFTMFIKKGFRKEVEHHTFGCLCKLKARYNRNEAPWQQGMGVIKVELPVGAVHITPIRFKPYSGKLSAVWGDKFYTA